MFEDKLRDTLDIGTLELGASKISPEVVRQRQTKLVLEGFGIELHGFLI